MNDKFKLMGKGDAVALFVVVAAAILSFVLAFYLAGNGYGLAGEFKSDFLGMGALFFMLFGVGTALASNLTRARSVARLGVMTKKEWGRRVDRALSGSGDHGK